MALKQNAADLSHRFPAAAKTINDSLYRDDGELEQTLLREINLSTASVVGIISLWWFHIA